MLVKMGQPNKDIQFEDKNDEENITVDEEKVIKLDKLEQDLMTGFKEEFTEQALASSIAISDKKRLFS